MLDAHRVTRNADLVPALCALCGWWAPFAEPWWLWRSDRAHLQLLGRNILGILKSRPAEKLHQRRHHTFPKHTHCLGALLHSSSPPSSIFISKPPVSFLLAETTPFSRLQAGTPLPVPGTDSTPNPLRSQAQQVPRRARPPTPSPWRTHVAHSRTPLRAHTHTSSLAALEMRGAKSPHPLSSVDHEKSGWEEVATREKEQIGAKAKSEGRTNSNWVVLRLLRLSSPPSQRVRFQHKSARGIAAPCNQ